MATASNAQREPSMEEILASIRKIIEDSDPIHKGAEDAAGQDQAAAAPPADSMIADMDNFRAELRGGLDGDSGLGEKKPASGRDELKVPSFSASETPVAHGDPLPKLADIGSRFAAEKQEAAAKDTAPVWPAPRQPTPFQTPPVTAHIRPAFEAAPAVSKTELAFTTRDEKAHETRTPLPTPGTESLSSLPSSDIEPVAAQTLVSEQTSRQVAASFGELSEVFASRGRKSLDEMAEDMLRPMLQDWLDNNLPTLVERLVREEIERVARGG